MEINKYGFRDYKNFLDARPVDFFTVGDSFAFGWGVEEGQRYGELTQAITGVRFYNISVPGAGVLDYQKLVKYAQGQGARINNLLLSVCLENDIRDYAPPRNPARIEPSRLKKGNHKVAGRAVIRMRAWMAKNTAIYHAGAAVVHQNDLLRKIAVRLGLIIDNYAGMRKNQYSESALASTAGAIVNLARPFNSVVVIIPSRALWVGDNRLAEDAVHNKLVSLLRESGVNVVDLRAAFEEGALPLRYYFKQDGHWNQYGHLKAAQAIAAYLDKNRILYNPTQNKYN